MLTQEQINQIRSSSGLPINTNKENYVGKYDYLKTKEKPGTFSRMISQSATAIKERGQEVKESFTKSKEGKISPIQGAGRIVGSTIAGAGDILFNVIKEGVRAISPQAVEDVKSDDISDDVIEDVETDDVEEEEEQQEEQQEEKPKRRTRKKREVIEDDEVPPGEELSEDEDDDEEEEDKPKRRRRKRV